MADFEEEILSGSDSDVDSDVEDVPIKPKKILNVKKIGDDEGSDEDEDINTDDDEPIDNTFDDEDEDDADKYVLRTLSDEDETEESKKQKRRQIGLRDEDETFEESDDDEDDDNDDENYLQKFSESLKTNVIEKHHPELMVHNHHEVEAMSRVVRDENGNIIDPLHKTMPFITKFEKARLLGERAKQINAGAQPMVKVDDDIIDGYLIALQEYQEKKIPMILCRPLPNGGCEYWKLQDLELI
jgi:DNA-directed RNA polymerase I, II, and III subunit RPABC2